MITVTGRYIALFALLASLVVIIADCSGGGSGSDSDGGSTTLEFNIQSATAVLAHENTITYQTSPISASQLGASLKGKVKLVAADGGGGETNLVAVDDAGNTWPAITSEYQVSVMYSVMSPDGEYLYVALDGMSQVDYAAYIIESNCAFYQVKIADDSYQCVMEGVHLVDTNKQYAMTVSSSHKPIQFDDAGNIYFMAWTFEVFCATPDADDPQCNTLTQPIPGWKAYRVTGETGNITPLTTSEKNILSFIALPSGDVILDSYYDQYNDQLEWFNASDGSLTEMNAGNGVSFYTADSSNTVIWGDGGGDWNSEWMVRFSRRGPSGLEHAGLSKDLVLRVADAGVLIDRIIVGDNGRIYAAFGDLERLRWDEALQQNKTIAVQVIQQILPYDPVPIAELEFPDITATDFWQWMDDGPFQVSGNHFYYIQTSIDPNYGNVDSIHMVRLTDRSHTELLSTLPYDIYNWRLSGNIIYFSALDITRDVVVFGSIDTTAVQQGLPTEQYLTLQDVGSVSGAISAVDDIEVLVPQPSETDPGGAPVIEQFHTGEGSTHGISLDFSKFMNYTSVNSAISLSAGASIDLLPVWISRTLHAIPDLDGLDNYSISPLDKDSIYTVSVAGNAQDYWDNLLSGGDTGTYPLSTNFTTDCATGWCAGSTDVSGSLLSSDGAIRHISNLNTMETYNLGIDASGHIRLEFSARNYSLTGISTILWDQNAYQAGGSIDYSDGLELEVRMNMQPPIDNVFLYNTITPKWVSAGQVFNGEWRRYRLDIVGTTATLSTSEDGVSYTPVTDASITGLPERATAGGGFLLFLRMDREVIIDNLRVQPLDAGANEIGASLLVESFEDVSGNPDITIAPDTGIGDGVGFDDDVTSNYGLTGY